MRCPCFHMPENHLKVSLRYRRGKSKLVSHKEKKSEVQLWLLMTGVMRFFILSNLEQTLKSWFLETE